jgi:hypothetical protein
MVEAAKNAQMNDRNMSGTKVREKVSRKCN